MKRRREKDWHGWSPFLSFFFFLSLSRWHLLFSYLRETGCCFCFSLSRFPLLCGFSEMICIGCKLRRRRRRRRRDRERIIFSRSAVPTALSMQAAAAAAALLYSFPLFCGKIRCRRKKKNKEEAHLLLFLLSLSLSLWLNEIGQKRGFNAPATMKRPDSPIFC